MPYREITYPTSRTTLEENVCNNFKSAEGQLHFIANEDGAGDVSNIVDMPVAARQ